MTHNTFTTEIIGGIQEKLIRDGSIDLQSLADSLDHNDNLDTVRKFVTTHTEFSRRDWDRAVNRARVKTALGEYPATANDLLRLWVTSEKVEVLYNRKISKRVPPRYLGELITPEERLSSRISDCTARIIENGQVNTETLKRDLRQLSERHRLGFSREAISDAVGVWFDNAIVERKITLSHEVSYQQHKRVETTAAAWSAITGAFDPDDSAPEYVRAVLSKFIWQVKRKLLGLEIFDHLMPVVLGPQGVGKSTLIRNVFLKPVEEVTMNTDFSEITDNRNHDMWRFFVLFMDEMSHAGKADMDTVKNLITLPMLQRRPMGSNDVVNLDQNATFIGCSNREIEQLIRDETGNRRFAALRFSSTPDHAAINAIDPLLLWQSVDEWGEDPMKPFHTVLKAKQAEWRERSQVEQWLAQFMLPTSRHGQTQFTADLYKEYTQWADTYYHNQRQNYNVWSKELKRVVNNYPELGWGEKRNKRGSGYCYGN